MDIETIEEIEKEEQTTNPSPKTTKKDYKEEIKIAINIIFKKIKSKSLWNGGLAIMERGCYLKIAHWRFIPH